MENLAKIRRWIATNDYEAIGLRFTMTPKYHV